MTERPRFKPRTRWQIALRYSGLPTSARAVGWALSTLWNMSMDPRDITGATLGDWVDVDRATVFRALAQLEKYGWIYRDEGKGGRGRGTSYGGRIPEAMEDLVEEVLSAGARKPRQAVLMGPVELTPVADVVDKILDQAGKPSHPRDGFAGDEDAETVAPTRRFDVDTVADPGENRRTHATVSEDAQAQNRRTHATRSLSSLKTLAGSSNEPSDQNRRTHATVSERPCDDLEATS